MSVWIQKRLIITIFPHGLRPLRHVGFHAEPPVDRVRYGQQLVALFLPETRDVAGVPYEFQARTLNPWVATPCSICERIRERRELDNFQTYRNEQVLRPPALGNSLAGLVRQPQMRG